jgi:2-oxoglutarate/2-oxoacid ferredoxin oxidoreductase subunit alpha
MTRHAPPGARIASGKYPTVTGLEHDELGHPTGNPGLHMKMTAKRREKIKALGAELPVPEVFGETEGDVLLVGWGSTWGPIREAVGRLRASGVRVGQIHLRHIHPLPPGLEEIFLRFRHVLVVEMNDEGLYGFGQLAMLLRARYALPAIKSVTKTDGLTFQVREIVEGAQLNLSRNGNGDHP